jgi:hypothetical protein
VIDGQGGSASCGEHSVDVGGGHSAEIRHLIRPGGDISVYSGNFKLAGEPFVSFFSEVVFPKCFHAVDWQVPTPLIPETVCLLSCAGLLTLYASCAVRFQDEVSSRRTLAGPPAFVPLLRRLFSDAPSRPSRSTSLRRRGRDEL